MYQTPAEEGASAKARKKLTIDEELGAENVRSLGNDWYYPPTESEVTEAVENLLKLQTPMDVDPPPEERQYQFFKVEEADTLGPYQQPGSPVTTEEDPRFGHARRLLQSSGRWKTAAWIPGWRFRSANHRKDK